MTEAEKLARARQAVWSAGNVEHAQLVALLEIVDRLDRLERQSASETESRERAERLASWLNENPIDRPEGHHRRIFPDTPGRPSSDVLAARAREFVEHMKVLTEAWHAMYPDPLEPLPRLWPQENPQPPADDPVRHTPLSKEELEAFQRWNWRQEPMSEEDQKAFVEKWRAKFGTPPGPFPTESTPDHEHVPPPADPDTRDRPRADWPASQRDPAEKYVHREDPKGHSSIFNEALGHMVPAIDLAPLHEAAKGTGRLDTEGVHDLDCDWPKPAPDGPISAGATGMPLATGGFVGPDGVPPALFGPRAQPSAPPSFVSYTQNDNGVTSAVRVAHDGDQVYVGVTTDTSARADRGRAQAKITPNKARDLARALFAVAAYLDAAALADDVNEGEGTVDRP